MTQPKEQLAVPFLAIDNDINTLNTVKQALCGMSLEIHLETDPHRGLQLFQKIRPRIVLLDPVKPESTGIEVLSQMLERDPGVEVLLMGDHYSRESAVAAIQKGARDFFGKPLQSDKLRRTVSGLIDEASQKGTTLQLDHQLVDAFQFEGMIGRSPVMLEVFEKLRRLAPHFQTILITGETGTGKELVARALHRLRHSDSRRLAVCNCAAIVDTLFESEIFGHVKGAFTGAIQDKAGLFEYANDGTVFLDEIGEMPLAAQAKLLRVLQNQEIYRVGSPIPRKVDVRVVAATNRDLRAQVREGKFREDLFYRLGMIEIHLPRLADRKEDLPLLERFLLDKYSKEYNKRIHGLTRRAQACLASYSWPGNIRELSSALNVAVIMAEDPVVDIKDLPKAITENAHESESDNESLLTFAQLQERHMKRVLDYVGGDKSRAAEILGISRSTLYNLLARVNP